MGAITPGRCPGLVFSAPLARQRPVQFRSRNVGQIILKEYQRKDIGWKLERRRIPPRPRSLPLDDKQSNANRAPRRRGTARAGRVTDSRQNCREEYAIPFRWLSNKLPCASSNGKIPRLFFPAATFADRSPPGLKNSAWQYPRRRNPAVRAPRQPQDFVLWQSRTRPGPTNATD